MDKELVLKKLNTAFAPKGSSGKGDGYSHPHEKNILKTCLNILKESETGTELAEFYENSDVKVRIVSDMAETGFIPNGNFAYVTAPLNAEAATPRILLNLVRALREAEQEKMGYSRPHPSVGKQKFIELDWQKEQDILATMAAIAYEINKNNGLEEVIDEMSTLGYKDIMQGYIKDLETL